jgi:hypothetical protein
VTLSTICFLPFSVFRRIMLDD